MKLTRSSKNIMKLARFLSLCALYVSSSACSDEEGNNTDMEPEVAGDDDTDKGSSGATSDDDGAEPEAGPAEDDDGDDDESPEVTEPDSAEPEAADDDNEPEAGEPDVTEPEAGEPDVAEPEAGEPDASEPDTGEPDANGDDDAGADDDSMDPKTYEPTCDGLNAKLVDCGLLSSGDYPCEEPEGEEATCIYACLMIATCNILKTYECSGQATTPLAMCMGDCAALVEPFLCVEESLEIDGNWVCDGRNDCLDGSDEEGCTLPTFDCASGDQVINAALQCDGTNHCTDGSDEEGCPTFECLATGVEVPARWQCDGAEDCLDGSDEAGCAKLVCD